MLRKIINLVFHGLQPRKIVAAMRYDKDLAEHSENSVYHELLSCQDLVSLDRSVWSNPEYTTW